MADAPDDTNPSPDPAPSPSPPSPPSPSAPDPSPLDRGGPSPEGAPGQDGPSPDWMKDLPDELKGDKTLSRFQSLEDLARGHVEAHKVAKSKVVLPKADDPDSFARFAASVRPEDPASYEIAVPEGAGDDYAEAMRGAFFEAGLLPQQAAKLTEANNAYAQARAQAEAQKGQDALDALQAEMGERDFERGKQAAVKMLDRLGIDPKFDEDMARFIGGAESLRLFFNMAERMGELGRVEGTDIELALGNLKGDAAMAEARRMQSDPQIGPKLADPNSAERKKYDQLVQAASAEQA